MRRILHKRRWLHGVLHFVVLEEHNRVSNRREFSAGRAGDEAIGLDRADPAPGQLDTLIQKELQEIVLECMPALDDDYRRVLRMRADGMKYGEIAARLGISENTVATWVSRGIRMLSQCVRRRMQSLGNVRQVEKQERADESGAR